MWESIQTILNFKNPVAYAIPFFALFIGAEVYLNYRERSDNYQLKDSAASISMGVGSVVIDILTKSAAFFLFNFIYVNYGLFNEALSYTLLGWVLLFFLDDFTFYWHHRFSHQVRLLWAAHVNHHSSQHYNLSTALRQSWSELFYKYLWFLWLPFLGFPPLMILTQISISLIYQFWIHTKHINRFPTWFEFIFNTPSHHRVHHAKNIIYLDRNHAGILIIWDRMFGTFMEEDPNEPVIYGITTNINTYNPLKIASHEFINLGKDIYKAPTFVDKLKYIFLPPGWSHDGSTMTADEMRADWEQQQKKNTP
ncbi:sterol desaturase family protein [Aureispira sp. CCB-E]|uniref:sterol desaturase family protein n=1 Tax=Aureispira sp. CCB-E TaxID=3051121 RepID=UPI00286860CA|nr:sterol desaturase family protein [Aureispira sp. CCB-E]WMX15817.1 sterol desaturase family protein [Aureispira sp. CCB-E]